MSKRVCPWWLGYLLACPLRRWRDDPQRILSRYVREGMTVLEPGPGMGFFTIDLLRMVGANGRVVAVDVQLKMLARLKKRATKAKMAARLDARLASSDSMNIADLSEYIDFTLAFAVVHEFPSAALFFKQVADASKPGATILVAEPSGHVSSDEFEAEISDANKASLRVIGRPHIRGNHVAVLQKQ